MKIAELFRIDGQVALVTGGASGIGYACAEVLADNGAKVCILDRDATQLKEAKERLAAVSPDVMAQEVDVTDLASMQKAVADVVDRFGRL
ncbi:MAG: SDR family NAD(P)-dependent oxidoreductase, partial [Xanthobacteraceae bacterium]